jgi:cbb3-type cytochrome oxidase subunit 1
MQSNAALEYDYTVAKLFTFTTILFGILGMIIGTLIKTTSHKYSNIWIYTEWGFCNILLCSTKST